MTPPTNRADRRRDRKTRDRRIRVFSEFNQDLRPEQIAKILVAFGLEGARKEAEARAEEEARRTATADNAAEDRDAPKREETGDA